MPGAVVILGMATVDVSGGGDGYCAGRGLSALRRRRRPGGFVGEIGR
jgi:hypothetical protein